MAFAAIQRRNSSFLTETERKKCKNSQMYYSTFEELKEKHFC